MDFDLAAAPSHQVSGTVRDGQGVAVGGATVSIASTPIAAVLTDSGGGYAFASVPDGSYELSVAPPGCHLPAVHPVVVDADEVVDLAVAAKVDGFGYTCSARPPGYVEAGTAVSITGSDAVTAVPLPFPFRLYGTSYSTAYVSTNGLVGFASANAAYNNQRIPSPTAPNAVVLPYWDDLYVDAASSVRTQVAGAEPNRTFTIEWRNVRYHLDSTKRVDVEVVLHQSSQIEFHYRNIADDSLERGGSASIGIENGTGTVGLEYSYFTPSLPVGASSMLLTTAAAADNTAPDAVDDSMVTAGTTVVGVLANDTDPDGDALVLTGVSDPPHGTATMQAGGTVTYAPDPGFGGSDAFTYDIADPHGGTDRATVVVTIERGENRLPVTADDSVTTAEDVAVTATVLANDTDADGDPLVVTAVSNPAHGTATAVQAGSKVSYTPAADYHGPDSFTYDLADGYGGTGRATVHVTVTPVNDAPRAGDDAVTTPEDTSIAVTVAANDHDPEGDAFQVTRVFDVVHGTASLGADGVVTYVPSANFNGPGSFRYEVRDAAGATSTGGVAVTVAAVDDPTVAGADIVTTGVNMTTNVEVLANDSDVDGPLRLLSVSDPPHGTATIAGAVILYSPDGEFSGADAFSYVVGDGSGPPATGLVTVTVSSKALAIPMSVWTFPAGIQSLDGVGDWIVPVNAPAAKPGQAVPNYRYSVTFPFTELVSTATLSLSIAGDQRYASFSITRASGAIDTVRIPYSWAPGRAYLLLAGHVRDGLWQATVIDWANGAQKVIGSIQAAPQVRTAYPLTLTYVSWAGFSTRQCAEYPRAQVDFMRPVGVRAGAMVYGGNPTASNRAGDCPATNVPSAGVQVRYQVGQA